MITYLVRINLDIKEKNVTDALRFKVATDSIKSISTKNNKIVILSHRGRPTKIDKNLSLKPFAVLLSKSVGRKIVFIPNIERAKTTIEKAPTGTIFMLENIRFNKGEAKNSQRFAKILAELGDVYINNDFATSHHESASLVAITKYIPSRQGKIIKDEVRVLTKVLKNSKKPFVLIIGGAKVRDKASTIEKLLPKVDAVLLGGGVGNTFLKAAGLDIKKSLYEPNFIKEVKKFAMSKKIKLPIDITEERDAILDIGPDTRKEYSEIISRAKTIVWAGPMGKFEDKRFAKGNEVVAKAVLKNKKAHIVIGGVETIASLPVKVTKQHSRNVFFSTGGGAMLHFLSGKKLPALVTTKKSKGKI
ncbi:MAG: phosphoglycerate kinase [Candidatus Buchananbacteria bacterium RIFCSPHIGHO2_01_FULL_40_35]|nr:MAG: phosphoglycerate kinase [Candidatus Buchananbacteria bacterium RIFCSPHIGHO2_01_FULL_40_35]